MKQQENCCKSCNRWTVETLLLLFQQKLYSHDVQCAYYNFAFFLLCLNLSVQISLSVCADMCMLLAHFFFLNCFNYFFKWTKIVCYDKSHSNLSRRSSSEALKNIDAHKHHLFLLFFFRSFCAIASISICRMDFLRFTLFSPRSLLNRKRKNSRLSSMQIQFSKHLLVGCRCASSTFLRL